MLFFTASASVDSLPSEYPITVLNPVSCCARKVCRRRRCQPRVDRDPPLPAQARQPARRARARPARVRVRRGELARRARGAGPGHGLETSRHRPREVLNSKMPTYPSRTDAHAPRRCSGAAPAPTHAGHARAQIIIYWRTYIRSSGDSCAGSCF